MIILKLVYILMPVSIYMAFMYAPSAEILGDASRIIYFHVPCSWVATIAFLVSGAISILYLYDKKGRFQLLEEKAFNSASLGVFFTILATISGSIWSKISWGSYWNWDPKQISIIYLLLMYLAYFSLRAALSENPNKEKLSSVYLIFSMIAAPFLIFVVPRIITSLHPDIIDEKEGYIAPEMLITLIISVISFTLLYFNMFSISNRLTRIKQRIEDKINEE